MLGLRWSGIDLKADAAGTLKFLELNPSPMFLGFDRNAGTAHPRRARGRPSHSHSAYGVRSAPGERPA